MKRILELRTLVLGAAAAGLALLAALTAFSAVEARRHFDDLVWVERTHAVLDRLQDERVLIKNAELGRRAYLFSRSSQARADVVRATGEMIVTAASLQVMTKGNRAQASRAAELADAARDIREEIAVPALPGPGAPFPRIERASALTRALEADERRLLRDRTDHARKTARAVAVVLSSEFLFAALLGAAALWTILRGLAEREGLLAELTSANEELDAFARSAAHDLRTPLRAIDGFARILDEDHAPELTPDARRVLLKIREKSAGMSRLVDDLLAFSRAGRQAAAREAVDMLALARRAAADASDADPGRAIELIVGPLPQTRGDSALLALVWGNLLSNAYKYTRGRSPARIEIGGRVRDGGAEYWVKDNGVGFDPRHEGKLFKVFSRLHGSEIEGTGLGLALVRRIVERHGGSVTAEGALGAGARFLFYLPA